MRSSRETLKKQTRVYALNYTCSKDICKLLHVKTSETIHLGCDTKRFWVSSTVQVFFLHPSSLFFSFFFFFFFRQKTLTPNKELNKRREQWEAVSKCRGVFLKTGGKALTSGHTHVVGKWQHNSTPLFPPPCYNRTTNTDVKKEKNETQKKNVMKNNAYI